MLEQKLDTLNHNLERLISVLANTPLQPETDEPKAEPKDKNIGVADVRQILKRVSNKNGKDAALELLAKYNAKKVPDLSADDYLALVNDGLEILEG